MPDSIWQYHAGEFEKWIVKCAWCDSDMNERLDELFSYEDEPVCQACLKNTNHDPDVW